MLGGKVRGAAKPARQDKRIVNRPLTVLIGQRVVHADDWSMGGFAVVMPLNEDMRRGARLMGFLGSEPVDEMKFLAEIVRADKPSGRLAVRFIRTSPDCFDYMEATLRGRADVAAKGGDGLDEIGPAPHKAA
jgi:hypothetical protein